MSRVENCSCHINPPCSACLDTFCCDICDEITPNDLNANIPERNICDHCARVLE
jgi:hypothetical protein